MIEIRQIVHDGHLTDVIEAEAWVPAPVERVFEFFSSERNLETITPEFLHFKVVGKSTRGIEEGTLIDYRLRVHGFPMKWRSRIEEWKPGERFVDRQLRGPYAYWHHTHEFIPENGGTRLKDRVLFRVPFGKLGRVVAGKFVRGDVKQIFEYRQEQLIARFGSARVLD